MSERTLDVGDQFFDSDYTLIEKIGEGGFAQVYSAKNKKTLQRVAIKIITVNDGYSKAKRQRYIDRFERETSLSSRLHHLNIVRLLDKGRCGDNLVFAVFEYIEGETLRDRLFSSGALMPEDAAEVMAQILDGLVHAHERGVVHRDIKPANIMLSKIDEKIHVKIVDFGIGALIKEARDFDYKTITLTNETLGTPSYSAPEQLRGEPATPKTDIYVWGLVLLECLTGAPAISGTSVASIVQKQLNSTHVSLPAGLVGHPLGRLLRGVLNKNVNDRVGDTSSLYRLFTQLNFSSLVGRFQPPLLQGKGPIGSSGEVTNTLLLDGNGRRSGLAEQKHITALCITLVSYSTAGALTDKNAVGTFQRDQMSKCIDIATRFGATHAGTLADTLLFYFGYPRVSGSDARLCARAALEFIGYLQKRRSLLNNTQSLFNDAKIGIHTGMVTVTAEELPEGDTPNIAMYLGRMAKRNQILCSESSRKMLESFFDFEASTLVCTGMDLVEIPVYSIVGEKVVGEMGFLSDHKRHRNFFGREYEVKALIGALSQNVLSRSVYVGGEAGMGKSRLVLEYCNTTREHLHTVIQCFPENKNNALLPVLAMLKKRYALSGLPPHDAINRLTFYLQKSGDIDCALAIPILCVWLNYSIPPEYLVPSLPPKKLKILLFDTLSFLLAEPMGQLKRNTLFLVEDIHWADETTLAFLAIFIAQQYFIKNEHRFICTSRESLPKVLAKVVSFPMLLTRLNHESAKALVSQLFEGKPVSSNILSIIDSRAEGIPLFIEELVRLLTQRNLVHFINGKIDLINTRRIIAIPETLNEILQQKIDALSVGKDVIQLASAMGRVFRYDILSCITSKNPVQLQCEIDELVGAELIYRQRKVGGDCYVFKHDLIRDTAYASMPCINRKRAHRHIAYALVETLSLDAVAVSAGTIAMHFGEAAIFERAVEYGLVAAEFSLARYSSHEVIIQAEKNKQWLGLLGKPAPVECSIKNIRLLAVATMKRKGLACEELRRYSDEYVRLLLENERYYELVATLWWRILTSVVGNNVNAVVKLLERFDIAKSKDSVKDNDLSKTVKKCAQACFFFARGSGQSYPKIRQLALACLVNTPKCNAFGEGEYRQAERTATNFYNALLSCSFCPSKDMTKSITAVAPVLSRASIMKRIPSVGRALMYLAELYSILYNRHTLALYSNVVDYLPDKGVHGVCGYYDNLYYRRIRDVYWGRNDSFVLISGESNYTLSHYRSMYSGTLHGREDHIKTLAKLKACVVVDNYIRLRACKTQMRVLTAKNVISVDSSNQLSTVMPEGDDDATLCALWR